MDSDSREICRIITLRIGTYETFAIIIINNHEIAFLKLSYPAAMPCASTNVNCCYHSENKHALL